MRQGGTICLLPNQSNQFLQISKTSREERMASYSMHYSHGRTDLYDVVVPQGFTAGREPMGAESEGRVNDSICERKSKIVKKTFR